MSSSQLDHIKTLLTQDELLYPGDPHYNQESSVWSAQKDLHPQLVARPRDVHSLSRLLSYLNTTDLSIAIRSQGFGSSSARDVLISLSAFDEFSFDRASMTVTLGAGQTWRDYYTRMEAAAPDCAVVASRSPFIGVGGSILSGGFSWLAHEHGIASDPANLLDAEVVKMDGTVVWAAAEDPALLWALRGSVAGFGAVTRFKLRAFLYPRNIYSGMILVPRGSRDAAVPGLVRCANAEGQPRVGVYFYCMRKEQLAAFDAKEDMLVISVFDANGEAHGRGENGFKWALDLPGAVDVNTQERNLREVSQLQEGLAGLQGKTSVFWNGLAVGELAEELVRRAFAWQDRTAAEASGTVKGNVYCVFDGKASNGDSSSGLDAAWPKPKGFATQLLLGVGCMPNMPATAEEEQAAKQLVIDAPSKIMGSDWDLRITPNCRDDYHDDRVTYGHNYDKLVSIKRRVDPNKKLGGPFAV